MEEVACETMRRRQNIIRMKLRDIENEEVKCELAW
jgi:hypothetical protein